MNFDGKGVNVGVVIFNGIGISRILLVKNKAEWKEIKGKRFFKPSRWGLPNGRKEPGESIIAAAVREVEEETGLVVRIEPKVKITEDAGDHLNIAFLGQVVGGKMRRHSEEIIACDWFSVGGLPKNMYHSHQRRLSKLLRKMRKTKSEIRR